jgi:anti-sigma factor (TIGR02949 family)
VSDCQDWIVRLTVFLEGDLDPSAAASLAKHIEDCVGCSEMRIDDALVRRVRECCEKDTAPSELRERIVREIGSPPDPR